MKSSSHRTSLTLMADRADEEERQNVSMWSKFVQQRKNNTSKTQKWLLDEDCHNIFAFVGGYIDSAGYVKLEELFTSSITGNLVAATASEYSQYGVIARVLVAVFFAIGVYITGLSIFKLKLFHEWSGKAVLRLFILVQMATLSAGMVWGYFFQNAINADNALNRPALIVCACLLSFSMGVQSANVKENFPNCPSTTVITMMIVTFSSQAAGATTYAVASAGCTELHPPGKEKSADHSDQLLAKKDDYTDKLVSTTRQLLSFLVGGVIGASLMFTISFASILIPLGLLVIVFFDTTLPPPPKAVPNDHVVKHQVL